MPVHFSPPPAAISWHTLLREFITVILILTVLWKNDPPFPNEKDKVSSLFLFLHKMCPFMKLPKCPALPYFLFTYTEPGTLGLLMQPGKLALDEFQHMPGHRLCSNPPPRLCSDSCAAYDSVGKFPLYLWCVVSRTAVCPFPLLASVRTCHLPVPYSPSYLSCISL